VAAAESLGGLLPGARGLADTGHLDDIPERPDLLAADQWGAAVAIVVGAEAGAAQLQRAVAAREWTQKHLRLLAQAFPKAGLEMASGHPARAILLMPDAAVDGLSSLCPVEVELTAYTGVSLGGTRGLMFRPVRIAQGPRVGATGGPLSSHAASWPPATASGEAAQRQHGDPPAFVRRSVVESGGQIDDLPSGGPTAPIGGGPAFASAKDMNEAGEGAGSSPDDDLSADEMNDLRSRLDIDELT